MSLIIPGVSVQVVSEVVASSLLQTGVLGILGCTERPAPSAQLQSYGSVAEVVGAFGMGTLAAMPELKQAFIAGLNQAVVVSVKGSSATAQATIDATLSDAAAKLTISARAPGKWGNSISVRMIQKNAKSGDPTVDVEVFQNYNPDPKAQNTPVEVFRNLYTSASDPATEKARDLFWQIVNGDSQYIRLAMAQGQLDTTAKLVPTEQQSQAAPTALQGGADPVPADFAAALELLEPIESVDMVVTSHQLRNTDSQQVNSYVLAHCQKMAKAGFPRLGFGQVALPFDPATNNLDIISYQSSDEASLVISDRFVYASPQGYVGALIGTIAALNYWESPTFKPITGVGSLPFDYTTSHLNTLIKSNVCAIDYMPHRGIICVKGVLTNGQPINVTRVADYAVRRIKMAAEAFIGLLNTETQRLALKQQINAALTDMDRAGAIVPSADGKSPSFTVAVTCTPDDFAQGRVMIQAAIRPVRSIDYIYATLFVQAS